MDKVKCIDFVCSYYPVISKYIKQTLLRNEQRISVWLKHTDTICSNIPHARDKVRPRESTFPQPVKRSVDFMYGSAPIPYPTSTFPPLCLFYIVEEELSPPPACR